jgi:hypothetical protein
MILLRSSGARSSRPDIFARQGEPKVVLEAYKEEVARLRCPAGRDCNTNADAQCGGVFKVCCRRVGPKFFRRL